MNDVQAEPGVVQALWCSYRFQWLPNFRYRITLVDLGLSASEASKSGLRYPNDDDDGDEDADDEEGDDDDDDEGLWLDATWRKTLIGVFLVNFWNKWDQFVRLYSVIL